MKIYTAVSHGLKEFELFDDQNVHQGKIIYPKWYSYDMEIRTPKGHSSVKMEGFWGNHIVHYDVQNRELRRVNHTWKGFVFEERSGEKYFLETAGLWDFHYNLKNTEGEVLMTVKYRFTWKKMKSDYTIEVANESFADPEIILLVLHCVNYQMHVTAAASS